MTEVQEWMLPDSSAEERAAYYEYLVRIAKEVETTRENLPLEV